MEAEKPVENQPENVVKEKSFLGKVPGFRSGKLWKKILASITYFVVLLAFISCLLPGPSVEEVVENARGYVVDGEYSFAVTEYKKALENWEDGQKYPFGKAEIEEEMKNAEGIIKANELLDKAEEFVQDGDNVKAANYLALAAKEAPDYGRVEVLSQEMSELLAKETEDHIANAKEAAEIYNVDAAEEELETVMALDPDNEKIESLKTQIQEAKDTITLIGPAPINSAWDGSVSCVKDFLEANLKDPDSCEYIEWSPVTMITLEEGKCWAVRVKYRAKNSFGGYVIEEQIAYILHDMVIGMEDFSL